MGKTTIPIGLGIFLLILTGCGGRVAAAGGANTWDEVRSNAPKQVLESVIVDMIFNAFF